MIDVRQLAKVYRVHKRDPGMTAAFKALFHRTYDDVRAVDGISFHINPGERVGFLGPNGAGKTTTLKMLAGLLHPSAGEAKVLGFTPFERRPEFLTQVTLVMGQKQQLLWDLPPSETFAINKAIYQIPDAVFRETIGELTELLQLGELVGKPTRQLSLGERMKCELAAALVHEPKVLFLDEPTIGLDVIAKETIRSFILEMNKAGVTFILTTHDLADIEFLARRVMVVNHGELVFDGSLEALKVLFGERRLIRVQTERDILPLSLPGLREVSRRGPADVSWELDLGKSSLEDFLRLIGKHGGVKDMSLGEVPIENIIREVYEKEH